MCVATLTNPPTDLPDTPSVYECGRRNVTPIAHDHVPSAFDLREKGDDLRGCIREVGADWSTIEHLRTEIGRNIDSTRVLLRLSMTRAEAGRSASSRAGAAKRLLDADFVEGLALLALCEHNLASWHHLRVQRVRESEPLHLDRTLARVESDLALHRLEDQRLVDDLTIFVDDLAQPRGLEGLELSEARSAGIERRGAANGDRPLRHTTHARRPW